MPTIAHKGDLKFVYIDQEVEFNKCIISKKEAQRTKNNKAAKHITVGRN